MIEPFPSHQQIFFMHLPATGGAGQPARLLADALRHWVGKGRFRQVRLNDIRRVSANELTKYRVLRAHWDYSVFGSMAHKPVYVTLLRHPVAALISYYRLIEAGKAYKKKRSWELDQLEAMPALKANPATYYLAGVYHEPDGHSPEAMLEVAMTRLEEFAFMGLHEQFDLSMRLLGTILGAPSLYWEPFSAQGMVVPSELRERAEYVCRFDLQLYHLAQDWFHQQLKEFGLAAQN